MSNAAFRLLWCFVFVLPWDQFVYVPLLGSIPRLVGLVASGVAALYILARRRVRPLSAFHVFALLFVIWAGVSAFWSIDPEATRVRIKTYVQLLVLVWLIWEVAWSPERQRALLQAYVLGACVLALATIHNYLTGVPLPYHPERFTALNQNANELGITLAIGLPMAWFLSLSQPDRRFAWLWQLSILVTITATLLTASRGAFLAAVVALLIIPWTLGRLRLRTKVALYVAAVGTFLLATQFVPEASLDRILTTRADIEAGYFGGRGDIWNAGLQVAQDHPVAGVGAGAYSAAVGPTLHGEWGSHDVFLAILVEDGAVGLVLFFAVVAAAIRPVRPLPPLQRRFGIVLLLALAVGSVSIEWENRKQFWFVLGLLATQVALRPGRRPLRPAVAGALAPGAPMNT
jgi:O-antigen ligase